ncbi:hypothetical protein ACR782_14885 [Sphingobacterium spiritivorum]|uniref:Uncharacterized protein n=1 Tax=Sphingobacterium spiritivorum TaxID=258 RepID=A0A380BP54_SPHSI|nr:hypothetical protein [Sphingobacterium spiritivorum]SUJ04549.1 Uncharacterised protein [Sphingobacterium spiritivorum]
MRRIQKILAASSFAILFMLGVAPSFENGDIQIVQPTQAFGIDEYNPFTYTDPRNSSIIVTKCLNVTTAVRCYRGSTEINIPL